MLEHGTDGDETVADDLPFGLARHLEALGAMQRLGLDPRSIRPALIARERAVYGSPGSRIQIRHEPGEDEPDIIVEQIHVSSDSAEGALVRQDVENYFLRHFPGRTTAVTPGPATGAVYIVCQRAPAAD